MMLIPLGTSSGVPTRDRNVSSIALQLGNRWVLFDCGEGTQYRLMQAPLKLSQLDSIFITHLHGDHVFGLPGMLNTFSLQRRMEPLHVFGPPGIRELLQAIFMAVSAQHSYELIVQEVSAGPVHQGAGYRVSCAELDHRVQAFGYRLEETAFPHRKIAYCTDTRPCEASASLGADADVLIHESTYLHEMVDKAHERGHSTAREAAEIAVRARARKLLLTHFSPRYRDLVPLLEEARAVFPPTEAAQDLLPVPIPFLRETQAA